jgi:flagellar biosynthetic protein FliP
LNRVKFIVWLFLLSAMLLPNSSFGQSSNSLENDLNSPGGRIPLRPAGTTKAQPGGERRIITSTRPLEVAPLPAPPRPEQPPAELQLPGLTISGGSQSLNIVILLTLLVFIPAILLSMTPFVRLLVVFHFLRQALGTQNLPTNQTLIGLALFLTYFIMQPVGQAVYQQAVVPLDHGSMTLIEALDSGSEPARQFMLKYAREKDLGLFIDLAHEARPETPEDVPMRVVVPAYILSELRAGFQIGVVLFLPFLVIDLVVASVTTSMGMLQLPPVVISTPLKLLLFVLVDGWNLVVGSLLKSFF